MLSEKVSHMGQRTTRAKVMSYLSAQAQKSGAYEFDIPFSRQQLADYLAVERSGLSVELCKMRDEGLLEFHKSQFCAEGVKHPVEIAVGIKTRTLQRTVPLRKSLTSSSVADILPFIIPYFREHRVSGAAAPGLQSDSRQNRRQGDRL